MRHGSPPRDVATAGTALRRPDLDLSPRYSGAGQRPCRSEVASRLHLTEHRLRHPPVHLGVRPMRRLCTRTSPQPEESLPPPLVAIERLRRQPIISALQKEHCSAPPGPGPTGPDRPVHDGVRGVSQDPDPSRDDVDCPRTRRCGASRMQLSDAPDYPNLTPKLPGSRRPPDQPRGDLDRRAGRRTRRRTASPNPTPPHPLSPTPGPPSSSAPPEPCARRLPPP